MNTELLVNILMALFAGSAVFVAVTSLIRGRSRVEQVREELAGAIRGMRRSPGISLSEKKKEALLAQGPKAFYYLDRSQVEDLYPQVFQEPEPKRIETRETKETKKGIAAKLKFLEPEYKKGRAEELTKIYDMEQSLGTMYNRIEQYLVEKDKVTFGLEEFEWDRSSIDEFKTMCQLMQSKLNFQVPSDLQAKFAHEKMVDFALENLEKLSNISGYVAIQAELSVVDISNNVCTLSLIHPMNTYLVPNAYPVSIRITCANEYTTPSGSSVFKRGKLIKITCLGKVVSWDRENATLEISPIAIY